MLTIYGTGAMTRRHRRHDDVRVDYGAVRRAHERVGHRAGAHRHRCAGDGLSSVDRTCSSRQAGLIRIILNSSRSTSNGRTECLSSDNVCARERRAAHSLSAPYRLFCSTSRATAAASIPRDNYADPVKSYSSRLPTISPNGRRVCFPTQGGKKRRPCSPYPPTKEALCAI